MLEYIIAGAGSAGIVYGAYCNISFYKELRRTIKSRMSETKNKYDVLKQIFRGDGVHLYSKIQPASGIPPKGEIGTFFLKPTIHLAKTMLMKGAYDNNSKI